MLTGCTSIDIPFLSGGQSSEEDAITADETNGDKNISNSKEVLEKESINTKEGGMGVVSSKIKSKTSNFITLENEISLKITDNWIDKEKLKKLEKGDEVNVTYVSNSGVLVLADINKLESVSEDSIVGTIEYAGVLNIKVKTKEGISTLSLGENSEDIHDMLLKKDEKVEVKYKMEKWTNEIKKTVLNVKRTK